MKKKYLIVIFVIIFILGLLSVDLFSFTDLGDNLLGRVFFATGYRQIGSGSIVPAIEKTGDCEEYSKLVLGDSVANQVFNKFADENDDYLITCTNQAITMTGQYILAKRFLESSANPTDIYISLLPGGFSTDHTAELSYSYLIEPFGKTDCLKYLSEETRQQIKEYYGALFVNQQVIRLIDDSCINNKLFLFYNQNRKVEESEGSIISQESYEYLVKLYEECELKGVDLHIIASPMVDSEDNKTLVELLETKISDMGLEEVFDEYFEHITYYPADMFGDGVHFAEGYNDREHCAEYIDSIVGDSSIFSKMNY